MDKKKINLILQALLAIFLLVMGLNKFFHYMPPPEMAEPAVQLMGAFKESGYMMPMVGVVEIVIGILLLLRLWSALALVLLAPLSVNVIAFHLALAPGSIWMALFLAVLNVYLLFVYRHKYIPILQAK